MTFLQLDVVSFVIVILNVEKVVNFHVIRTVNYYKNTTIKYVDLANFKILKKLNKLNG